MQAACASASARAGCFCISGTERRARPTGAPPGIQQRAHAGRFERERFLWSSRRSQCSRSISCEARFSENLSAAYPEGFDLATAIALAGCSFEAYLEPEVCTEIDTTTSNGVEVTYTSRDHLRQMFEGYLEIELKSASGLPEKDFLGKSDPYVILSVSGTSQQSKTIDQDLNPAWNQSFRLYVRNAEKDVLRMRVRDADTLKSDDELGSAMYPVKKFTSADILDLDIPLQGDGGGGTLSISGRFFPLQVSLDKRNGESTENNLMDVNELRGALQEANLPKVWRDLAVLAGKRADERFDPVCFLQNHDSDTQVWIYKNDKRSSKKEIVIAFRGTEQTKWKDLATDVNLQPAAFDYERTDQSKMFTNRLFRKSSGDLLVHKGFLDAYDSVRTAVLAVVDGMIGDGTDWRIFCTGHSLGGALATLCAYEMAARRNKFADISMYNYGSPRVGNKVFADEFNSRVGTSWRVTNPKDIVTTIPRLLGYAHVQKNVIIGKNGILNFCDKSTGDILEGRAMLDVVDELSETLVAGDKGTSELIDPIVNQELDLLTNLTDGSGLAEHMEDLYLAGLVECVTSNSEAQNRGDNP